ncbi:hypothetical protein Efla_006612 [Eimeria flavescens]
MSIPPSSQSVSSSQNPQGQQRQRQSAARPLQLELNRDEQGRAQSRQQLSAAAQGRGRTGRPPAAVAQQTADAFISRSWAPWGPCAALQPPAAFPHASRCVFLPRDAAAAATTTTAAAAASSSEPLQVTVLGAGQDVGRSAVYVRRGERGLLFDCGSHLGAKQARKLPTLNMLLQLAPRTERGSETQTMEEALLQPSPLFAGCTDATIISHFHMDHCGSLPSFTERLGYRNPIAMTSPTHALSPVLLLDSARIFKEAAFRGRQQLLQDVAATSSSSSSSSSSSGMEQWNYTEGEAQRCMRRCVALRLHEAFETAGWMTTPYYAGHVLGAAMMHSQLPGGLSVVYTGDFNTTPDRHLGSASIPRLQPDLLISECTYGSFVRPSKRITEREFCEAVHDALKKGGKVLIPVFAVGRAQELCMLLNSYWQRAQLQYPIYFGGGMTEKANKYYKLYVQWTGSDLAHRLDGVNSQHHSFADHVDEDESAAADEEFGAFDFSHISTLPPDVLTAPTPMVLLATPGMLHGGLALKALKLWAEGKENLVLLPGYCVRGTVGAMLIDGQRDIPLDARTRLKVACKIRYMSFSAHADTTGIQQLAHHLQPKAVLLVHGEKEGMLKLARVLQSDLGVPVFTPPTGQTLSIPLSRIQPTFPVYVDNNCLRKLSPAGGATTAAAATQQPSWACDDPGLTSLLSSPAMQRYLNRTADSSRAAVAFSPYFVPAASLFFAVSEGSAGTDDGQREAGRSGEKKDLHLLIEFKSLLSGATKIAFNACGSLALRAAVCQQEAVFPLPSVEPLPPNKELDSKCDLRCEDPAARAAIRGVSADKGKTHFGVPHCIQLVTLRYRQELTLSFAAFQPLLHLFMDYIVQCRQAYEQQRINKGQTDPALATPDFCEFGDQLSIRESDGGGVVLQFLSLIAIHDGRERLSIQWTDPDERRRGAVSLFVEYFATVGEMVKSQTATLQPQVACVA